MKPTPPHPIAKTPRLMLFDLSLGGHHGNYIQHAIAGIFRHGYTGTIDLVVLPEFLEIHRDTVAAIASYSQLTISIVPISTVEATRLGDRDSGWSRARRNLREWQLFCQYARDLHTTFALLMYLDTCELPLAMGKRSPCPFAGIYFRPTFHYPLFADYQPNWKDRLQQWRERIALTRILQQPQLQTIFCLDPFAVRAIRADRSTAKIVHLPDPVQPQPAQHLDLASFRTELGIEPQRRVFLLFGALDGRKGIYQLLEAIALLPPASSEQLCLLLVGKTNPTELVQIRSRLAALCQTARIQLVECYDFIPEHQVASYFQVADVVLAPYQRHAGMSGILLLAAAAGKPVVSANYGLMGELVRRHQLGVVVDTTAPSAIAGALDRCLSTSLESLGDRAQMQIFAEANSIDRYISTICQHLDLGIDRPLTVAMET